MKRKQENVDASNVKVCVMKPKPMRDENAPKPPINAYMHFMRETSKKYGNLKDIAAAWTTMNEEQKKPYAEKALSERLKYEKDMMDYKKTEEYKQFLIKKSIQRRGGNLSDGEHQLNGIPIFSKQFLEYNKSRESALRKLRKEIADIEDETEVLEKQIASLSNELENVQETLHADESQNDGATRLVAQWHQRTLKAMEDARLISHFYLNMDSSVEELLTRLEEASKKHDSHSNSLRTCLNTVNYG